MAKRTSAPRVSEVMTQPAATVNVGDTAEDAARLMWECDCGIVPVVRDDGRLAGVVTDRDLCMAAYTQGQPLRHVPVARAMATHVVAVKSSETVEAAEGLLRDNQIRRLPVVDDDGRPVGVLSLSDVARMTDRVHHDGLDRELVSTLSAICQPRGHEEPSSADLQVRPAGSA